MSGSSGNKRKSQGKQNGKWPEGAIKEEDEEVIDEDAVDDIDDGDEIRRGSYDVGELDTVIRRGSDADGQSTSTSI
jgi:hypothetical protein